MASNVINIETSLKKDTYRNWVKGALSLCYLKEGLVPFVDDVSERHHAYIIKRVSKQLGSTNIGCDQCSLKTLLPAHSKRRRDTCLQDKSTKCNCSLGTVGTMCPNKICSTIYDDIVKSHRFASPNWNNTNIQEWCNNPWEIAKCFIAANGYSSVRTCEQTDVSALLSILMNNLEMQKVSSYQLSDAEKIRAFRNRLFHSTTLELGEHEFEENISDMTRLLVKINETNSDVAQNDVRKLLTLKRDSFVVTIGNEAEVCRASISALEEIERDIAEANITKRDETQQEDVIDSANFYVRTKGRDEPQTDYLKKKKDLQTHLLSLYKQHYLKTNMYPFLLGEETDFATMFVQPDMIVEYQKDSRKGKQIMVKSLRDIFYTGDMKNKNILITGKAGVGKTTFCKRLLQIWCSANDKQLDFEPSGNIDDENIIKEFDFLFYVPLRNSKGSCTIHKLIADVVSCEPSNELLSEILSAHSEKCLVVLDGLDEWVHGISHHQSSDCPMRNETIPHVSVLQNFTILSTTRSCEMTEVKLQICNVQIRMQGLSNESASMYAERIVRSLSTHFGHNRQLTQFEKETNNPPLSSLKNIPAFLLHLICIWFDNTSFGDGLCRLYSDMLEQMINRAREKPLPVRVTQYQTKNLPGCFHTLFRCQEFTDMLLKLSVVAFNTMCCRQVKFSKKELMRYMSSEEIYWCFAIGLLTETTHGLPHIFSSIEISFIHKSFQDFFAALHLWTEDDFENAKAQVPECYQNQCVFDFDTFFIFISGMNPFIGLYLLEEFESNNECKAFKHREKLRDVRIACLKEIAAQGSYKNI